MENAFSNYNSLEIFFVVCAVAGGFFVLVKLFLQVTGAGMETDAGAGVDTPFDVNGHHADSDAGFKFLSLHGLSSFFMMFGLVKSLPPLHEVAGMAGIELPKYLGEMKADATRPEAAPGN
jgi:hypothetical protein